MLARVETDDGDEFLGFMRKLQIPPRPPELIGAIDAAKRAVAERQTAQARHEEATRQLSAQRPGQPPTITHADVDAVGAEIAPLIEAEREAIARRDDLIKAWNEDAVSGLAEPLRTYRAAVLREIAALESLIAIGSVIASDAVAARVRLPSKFPGICPALMAQLHAARAIITRAGE